MLDNILVIILREQCSVWTIFGEYRIFVNICTMNRPVEAVGQGTVNAPSIRSLRILTVSSSGCDGPHWCTYRKLSNACGIEPEDPPYLSDRATSYSIRARALKKQFKGAALIVQAS